MLENRTTEDIDKKVSQLPKYQATLIVCYRKAVFKQHRHAYHHRYEWRL